MISKLIQAFVAFSIGTTLTVMVMCGYFLSRGSINGETLTKVVALMNGIDITGDRLREIMRQSEDSEQPDFDEILEARKMESYDFDVRLRSQQELSDEISTMLADLQDREQRFDNRLSAFRQELKEIRAGAREQGLVDVQRTLQTLDAAQAKEQLLIMYDDERIDDVVTIVQAMSSDKRKDILAEFVEGDNPEKLAEILRRISEGIPTTALIDQASEG